MIPIILIILSILLVSSISNSFADAGDFIFEIDGSDGGGTIFDGPFGIAVDSADRIIVSDISLDMIQIFNPDGTFDFDIDGLGTSGGGTAFATPVAVAVDSLDRIIVSDLGFDIVQIYDSDGAFVITFNGSDGGTVFDNPYGVAVDSLDRIIVVDNGINLVQIFDNTGTFIFDIDGSDGGTLFVSPLGVAVDSLDRIIVSDNGLNTVQVFSPEGIFITSFDGGTAFSTPVGVAVDSNDRIIVADNGLDIVQIFTPEGNFITRFTGSDGEGTAFATPFGVAVDSLDRIIVSDVTLNTVQIYEGFIEEETILNDSTGGTGLDGSDDPNGACGDCTPPTLGLTLDHKRIVDRGFSYNGNPVQVEFWHTPYPLITARVGDINIVQITVYENSGASYLDMVQFGLGATEIGQPLNELEVLIEVYLEVFDENNIGVEKVIIKDRDNLLDTYATIAFVDIVKCTNDSQTKECVQVILFYSYRDVTINNVMVVSVSDKERNTQNFYFNEGLEIVGESLNEAPTYIINNKQTAQQTENLFLTLTRTDKVNHIWTDENGIEYLKKGENYFVRITLPEPYTCNDPPLSEINVPTRLNCNFRELTTLPQ